MSFSRITTTLVALGGTMALAACSDSPSTGPAATRAPSASVQPTLNRSIAYFPIRRMGSIPSNDTSTIVFHGGPVLVNGMKVSTVYWAAGTVYAGGPSPSRKGTGAQDLSRIGYFLRHLGASPYFAINGSYTNGAMTHITPSLVYSQFWANNSYNVPSGTDVRTGADMEAMLTYAFANGKLTYDSTTLYLIMTAGAVNLGGGFNTQYCGYHTYQYLLIGGVYHKVLYSAMPNDNSGIYCNMGLQTPSSDANADNEVSVLAHEIEETLTDPYLSAWWDADGNENADKCAWQFGAISTLGSGGKYNMQVGGRPYLIQSNWRRPGGCYKKLP